MASKKYILIDRSIIAQGRILDFDVYLPHESKKDVVLFKERNCVISEQDIELLGQSKALYINSLQHKNYQEHFENMQKETCVETWVEEKNMFPQSFEEKTAAIYSSATKILDDLFSNPETLGNYESSKQVVDDLVDNILDDSFTLKSLLSIAEHDYYTHTHSINVCIYAVSLGSFLGMTKEHLSELGESALLHDLGKSKIPSEIINKNGKLTDKEFKRMMAHPSLGYAIGLKLGITNKRVLLGIKHHHEKIDGSGYPEGFMGNGIPIFARIIGLCDIFDALTSKRSYKEAMSTFEALKLIKTQMSTHVDLKLLDSMVRMFK